MAYYFKKPSSMVLPAIIFSIFMQLLFLVSSVFVFDSGKPFWFTLYGPGFLYLTVFCMLGYWAGAAVFLYRRRRDPEKMDLMFYRYGFVWIFAVFYVISIGVLSL